MDETTSRPASPSRVLTTTRAIGRPGGPVAGNPSPSGGGQKRRHSFNLPIALVSLLIGVLLWVGIDLKRMEDTGFDIAVEWQRMLPADWRFVDSPLRMARITVRGTRQEIAGIRQEELMIEPEFPPGALDGDGYDAMLTLQATQIRGLPPGIEVKSITPEVTPIRLSRIMTKYLTVAAGKIVGTPHEGYVVGKIHQIDPPAMPISASKEFLAKIGPTDVLHTKEFNVDGGRGLVVSRVELEPFEKDGITIEVPGSVYMTVELEEMPVERTFDQPFEVRALIDSPFERYADLNISPPSVSVTVTGPKSVIDRLNANEVLIYADIRDRIPAATGEYNIKCKAITPARVRVTRIEPDTVKWITRDNNGAAASPDAPVGEAGSKPGNLQDSEK